MARIKKYGETLKQNLKNYQTFVTDTNPNSDYFRITEFKDTFTGGKNGFLIEGSQYLQETTEIKIQILDVEGNSIYWEPGAGSPEYYEGVSKPIAVHIYEDTPIGLGNITILAELKQYIDETGVERDIPDEWKGVYNVKWEKDFKINKNLQNEDKVRFYRIPKVDITEIVKPIFSNVVTSVTQTGNVHGIPLVPNQGTKLVDYTLPTSYLLTLNDGTAWTGSVIGNNISIPSLGYTAKPTDVLNDSQLVVSNPYTVSGLVSSFTSASFTTTFNYVEGVDNLATALTGSFAKINLNDLTTFIGDVARVKVFRKSQSDLSDYQFIQEVQLESNELLIDLESTTKNQEYYGLFDSNIITEYWLTSSNDITPTFNQNFLYNSVKLSNTGTNFYFTSKSLDITEGIEYTLDLNVRKTNNEVGAYLKAFISGSRQSTVNGSPTTIQIQQTIVNISSDNSVLQKTNSSNNIVAEQIDSASLYFEVVGDNWHISDVSLRASQESSFSPDEITFIQPIPRTLPTETFDFLFQFYDINNNYIPIVVEESKTFDGGNLNRINKSIELIPSSLYFAFDSASNGGNPIPPTTIFIDVVKNFLTGSTNFTSRSFDFFNNELSSSQYVGGVFPGKLEDTDLDTVRLTVEAFTGSVAPADPPIIVQFIEYTAECEGVEDSIIISRVQDGKGGVNYEIRPYNGTVIRNSDASSSLEVQAIRIDGINEIKLRDGLDDNQSDTQLFIQSGSTYITLAEASSSGFVRGLSAGLTGSGEINYNAIFNRDSIDGQRTVYLIPSSSNNYSASILTALTLTDLQDGLDAGVVLFDAENFTINPRTQTLFTPTFSSATASFYRRGTTEAPISCSFEIYPSMSINADFVPEYWMYFITHSCDPDISVIAYDEFGNEIPSLPIGAYTGLAVSQSKQVLTSFTYTEPFTSASVNVDKLFTIIPEGKPGDESIVFEVNPQNVSLNANPRGIVADYSSTALDIKLKQGARYLSYSASQEPGTFNIAQQNIIGRNITQGYVALHGDYTASLRVSASSTMTDLSGSIEFPLEIRPYYTSSVYTASAFQYLTKVLDGPPPIEFIFSPQNAILQADEVSYVSDYAASDTDIQVKEGDDYLTFTTQSNVPGTWRILSVTTNNIQTGSLSSSSFDNATLTFNRFDYPYVSASAVYSIKVNPYSLGPGHQYTSSIYTRTQTFTKNVAPPNARAVSLTSTAETVTFDGDGVVITPTGDIRLTAQAFNTTGSVYYQFFRDGSPYSAIQSDDFYDISSGDAVNPGEIATWRVDIRDGNSSAGADVRAQAQVTIAGIQAGAEAYSVILTNENSSISADLWDVTLTGTGNTISAFKGTTQLTHTNSFSPKTQDLLGNDIGSIGEYQVTIQSVSGHLTPGSSLVSGSILTTVGSSAVIGDLAGWTTPGLNQSGEIVYKVDIENGRQTFFKTQSFGVNIEPAAPYTVELSNQNAAVVYKVSGQLTTDGTGTTIRAFRGGTELTNSSGSFSTPQTDIYGNTGYKNQYRATVYSVPAYVDLNGSTVSGSYLTSNPAQIGTIDAWTDPVTNLTGEVIYQIELEGRETILKSQNFGIQLEGETGPGIVMRGQWDEVTNYIGSVETTNNRRDAVIYPDPSGSNGETHYFMALSGSGPGALDGNGVAVGPQVPPSPSNDTDYWQYLGQQDLFVAAKMAIFEESFVKNTINVGNNPGSSFANIVLSGGRTDPYLAIGQGGTQGATGTSGFSVTGSNIIGYDQPGIFLGMFENGAAGTTGRFSIKSAGGTAGTRGLFWDGDALYIIGAIRQVQPGQNEGGLRGLWSSGLVYYPDDIVTYQDQTWVMTGATHTSTNDSNASTGVPGSGPWTIAAAAGSSGTAGVPKTVVLGADTYVIVYDADGNNPSPASTIKLEATSSGFTDGYFKFTGGGTNFSDEASYTDGDGQNTDSATLNVPSSYFTTPLTMRVGVADGDQSEYTSDTITVFAVKPGADVSPQYMITPLTGTQIKNGGGTIELQVQQSDSTGLTDLTSGTDARLYKNDSSLLAVSMSGISDGGNGVTYNPVIDASAIDGTLILQLRDASDNVLDTITLLDVTDGLGGGSFLAPSMQMTRVNKTKTYTPSFLSVTASFFSTNQTEYTSSFRVFATASGVTSYTDNMYFVEGDQDPNITYTANNGDGVNFVGPGFTNQLATKDISFVATFTDPATSQTTTATETYYVVSEGADGIDAITVVNTNQAHTVPSANDGTVSSYAGSGLDVAVYEGTSSLSYDGVGTSPATWKVSSSVSPDGVITVGSITDNGDDITIGNHSSMAIGEDVATITYTITGTRIAGDGFTSSTTQTITKAKAGADGAAGTSGAAAKSVRLTSEAYVIAYDENGSNPSPSGTIKLIASSSNFSDGYFKFTGGGTNFSDEATFTDGTDSNNDSANLTIPSSYFTGPLTFRIGVADGDQVEIANDSLSIVAVKPGADVSPQYMIAPVAGGTQIKNGSGNITLQVRSSDSTGLTDITSGTAARLYKNDSSLLAVSMSGITDGGNGVTYNPTIGPDAIDGTLILELRDNSDNVLDTITLVDVTDGLGGGSFLAPSMQMTRTNGTTTYTPSFLSATASFFSTDGTEYTSEFRIFASASGVTEYTDNMYFDEGNQDANISYTANNGDGVNFSGPGFANSLATKDVNIVATFTDPNTGQTTTANETFYVVSDGADGIDAITVVAANTAHTLPAGSNGVVSDYTDSGIDILVYEGTSSLSYDGVGTSAQTWKIGTPYVNPAAGITVGSITDAGDNAVVGDHSSMDNSYSLVTITYPITGSRKNGDQFLTQVVQSITKAVAGINAKGLRISADSQIFAFDDSNDTTAADDTIRIYIDQQNLSGTVATTDITITPTGQSAFNPSTLTGTVTSGTGQQYFDVTFSSTFAADKTRLPVTISVTKDSITDIVSIFKVEGGADTSPMYMITSIAGGTQIKNGSGTIELQVQKSDVSGLTDVTSGTDARIYDGVTLLAAQTGVTDGGNGVAFNPIIAASFINGTKTLLLKDGSLNVLDSITLVDVSDGLGGGSFLSPTMNTTRQNGATTYTPTFLSATASFFDTSGTEYTKAVRLYPTYSAGVDNFYYENNAGPHNDSEIVLTLDDGDGTSFAGTGAGNLLPTKDVNITAVFTDPATSQTNTITETFYIVSDGADGVDALTIISTNQTHNFAASSQGVVGDYSDSGTEITVYEGTASLSYDGVGTSDGTWKIGTPYVNPAASITVGSISDNGDTALVGDHSSMDNSTSQLSITYPITGSRLNGSEFKISTTQTITKANQGVDAKVLSLTSDAQVFVFDDADDNKAADDTIRVYINQQNLSGDVVRTDITITDALAGSLIVPWLTGSVSSGTGEQYFDLYFNTGSSAVGYIDSKTKLPVTITVQKDSITDSTTLSKLEGGASNAPMYFIAPQNGTQIKNGQGSLQFKILESAPGAISEVSSGNIKIYSGSNLITTYGGVSGTDYNPTISAAAVYGSMTLILKDGSTTYDSLALIDVTDGLGGGSFLASALNTIRQADNSYLPTYLSATASFYDTNGTEYTKAWRITPNLDSGTDYMYYDNDSGAHTDSEITFTINDGDGTDYSGTGIGNKLPTKDLNIVATFTDPNTGQANTITETFYIVSDGADGLDAITVISTNQAHTAPASTTGVVSSYVGSGTTISLFEGITELTYDGVGTSDGTWTVSTTVAPTSAITVGSITDNGDNITIGDHSGMSNSEDVVTITYNISGKRSNGSSFTAASTQTITKAKIGATGAAGTQGDAGSPGAGVVYRGEFASTTSYFHTTTRRDVVRYAANYYLTSDTGFNSSAGSDWGTPGASTKWESFGAQFSSVATDILLAQDVYADRTVNVGADGPNPVIQLYADYPTNANPSIKLNLGTQGYAGTNGIFIGFDSSTPKLSLVNTDNTKYVKWTGSDLEVKGTINADAGVIGGFAITSNAISSSNNKLILRDNGEITGSAIYLTSGSMAGWTAQPNGLAFYESVVTGYTNQTSTTVTSSIANVFPTYLLASSSVVTPTITIPNSGTAYNISTRVDSDEITISTAIYKTPSTFLLSFMSSSYQGPALSTIEDGTYPGSWRTDYTNKFYAAAAETWEFDWIIDKDTSPTNYPGLNNASANVGYSMLTVYADDIERVLGFTDDQINELIGKGFIRRDNPVDLTDLGEGYPILQIVDSYDVNNYPGPGPLYGTTLSTDAFTARSFRVVDILNSTDYNADTDYDTFVLGVEVDSNTYPFEQFSTDWSTNTTLGTIRAGEHWDGVDASQPSLFNTVTLYVPQYVQRSSTTYYGGATVSAGSVQPVIGQIEAVKIASSGSGGSSKPYISMGQLTQSYDESGIFMGYSSGSTAERLSLKSYDGQKYFRWTGTNVELSGTVTAADGNIGGFVIGSDSIHDSGNNLILQSSGQITGSNIYLSKVYGGTEYPILDTANGIIDAKNNGRAVGFSTDEFSVTQANPSAGTEYLANAANTFTFVWQGLQYENKLFLGYQEKVIRANTGSPGSSRPLANLRVKLYYHQTASNASGTAGYDSWVSIQNTALGDNVGATSLSFGPDTYSLAANGPESIVIDIPEAHQTKQLKLEVLPRFAMLGSPTNTTVTTYVKNVSITTGRDLANTWTVVGEAPSFPTPPI